jgi:hypothetical protein
MTDQQGEYPTEPTGEGSGQPEGSATPPPADPPAPPPAAPAAPPAASYPTGGGFDADKAKAAFQGAHKFDLGMIAAGLIAWLAGFMPFYTASASFAGRSVSAHASAYHGFFGWFALWVALATAVVVALPILGVNLRLPVPTAQAAVGGFGLALLCLILALFITPGGDACDGASAFGVDCSTGRGFGFWLALILVVAGTALAFLRARETMPETATA